MRAFEQRLSLARSYWLFDHCEGGNHKGSSGGRKVPGKAAAGTRVKYIGTPVGQYLADCGLLAEEFGRGPEARSRAPLILNRDGGSSDGSSALVALPGTDGARMGKERRMGEEESRQVVLDVACGDQSPGGNGKRGERRMNSGKRDEEEGNGGNRDQGLAA